MDTIMTVVIGIIIAIVIYLILLYWLKASLVENAKAMGTDPETVPGYSGSWLPWDVYKDIEVLNEIARDERYNPNVDSSYTEDCWVECN